MSAEILVGLISLIGGIIVAAIGWLGRRDETTTTASETLINGQSARIDKLESRLDSVESALRETREELQAIQSHAGDLRDALRRALVWISEALEHFRSPDSIAPPEEPDVEAWRELIESPPRARNPPKTGSL